jgi:hypothetical protein
VTAAKMTATVAATVAVATARGSGKENNNQLKAAVEEAVTVNNAALRASKL